MIIRYLFLCLLSSLFAYQVKDDLTPDATYRRLSEPSGKISISGSTPEKESVQAVKEPGQLVYEKYCSMCHGYGVAGAPKFKDEQAWKARHGQGIDTLYKHAIGGYKGMPAKGNCIKCSDQDIKDSVNYILHSSGIK